MRSKKRPTPPGPQSKRRTKLSEYGLQLREKQKVKRLYGVLKNPDIISNSLKSVRASRVKNLLMVLEERLDNVVYRLGYAVSRKEARQLVNHGHFTVNGKKVDIPSYRVKTGDVIEVRESSRKSPKFKEIVESTESRAIVPWLSADMENLRGTVVNMPTRDDIDIEIAEHLIVELYSK